MVRLLALFATLFLAPASFAAGEVDYVQPGDPESEKAHRLTEEKSSSAAWAGKSCRQVVGPNGFFGYTLKCAPESAVAITYWGRDGWDGRVFDIEVDGTIIAEVDLAKIEKDEFHTIDYPIPPELTRGKKTIRVRLVANPRTNVLGGIFGVGVKPHAFPNPTPVRISQDYKGEAFGGFLEPLMLKEEWTLAVQVKPIPTDNTQIFAHGTSTGRRGTGVFGLATSTNGCVTFYSGGARANTHDVQVVASVPNRDTQMHLYVVTRRKDGYIEFSIDGNFAGAIPSLWAEPDFGFLTFGNVHGRGDGGLGFLPTQKNEVGRVLVWDRVLASGELAALAQKLPATPKIVPVQKPGQNLFNQPGKLLRLGRELPAEVEVSSGAVPKLAGKGVFAQCALNLGQRFTLGPGGRLEVGSLGLEFDSNYAHGKTAPIDFAGGVFVGTAASRLFSRAPVRLVEGTTTRLVVRDRLLLKTAFEGAGNLVISGQGQVLFAKACPNATGELKFDEGLEVAFASDAFWGGKTVKAATTKILRQPSNTTAAFPQPATAYNLKNIQGAPKGRGVCAWRLTNDVVRIGWRYLSSDPTNAVFDVYCDGKKVNSKPVDQVTYFDHRFVWDNKDHTYAVLDRRQASCVPFHLSGKSQLGYLDIELDPPAPRKTPDGQAYTYFPEDCSIGDLDGDGEYELVLAWWPTRCGDNFPWGQSGETILEAVKLDGTGRSLWRIDLGPNLRSGPHYNPFLVADFDNDGCAEIIIRSADGTVDGKGRVLNHGTFSFTNRGKVKDYRAEDQMVVFAPNYLTCFSGRTGEALDTIPYNPPVLDDPEAIARKDYGAVNWWWGSRIPGNQAFRFLAAVAYLDGVRPSAVMCRGYYSRTNLWAVDFDGKKLKERWFFCSEKEENRGYGGQGFHNLRIGDVDFDGKDEIVYGHMCVDHNGRGLWTTGYGHGDAMHLFQASPEQRGLVAWTCHEHGHLGVSLIDGETGRTLLRRWGPIDTGSCNAMDIDPLEPGVELFSGAHCGIYSAKDYHAYMWPAPRPQINYYANLRGHILWKGDLTTSSYSGGPIIWDYSCRKRYVWPIFDAGSDVDSVGGTKGSPAICADIFGDWREELVLRRKDCRGLRVFFSPHDTSYRFHTFMEDPVYRTGVLSQNAGYNVPTSPGFYFGPDLKGHNIWFRGCFLP